MAPGPAQVGHTTPVCHPGGQREALPAFELLEDARYMRKNKGKSIPDCPAVPLIGRCVAKGVQGLPSPCHRAGETPNMLCT